jgi:hypothetical protein
MVQPPQPADAQGAHPEPEPIPSPEPDPPQPIPPPDPIPIPEPPHTVAPATDFIDAEPAVAPIEFPPLGAYPGEPGHPPGYPGNPPGQPDDGPPAEAPTEQFEPVQAQQTAQIQPVQAVPAVHSAQPATWHQPPPTEPWHAHHEKAGEWQTHPPDHLAWAHSPPAEVPQHPEPPAYAGGQQPPPWQVPLTVEAEARRRPGGLWVSLALTVTLLLCGGGAVSAYFLISNADTGKGAPDPATAVNRFLTAVYTQQDASAADDLVCRDARDAKQLAKRVAQIKGYSDEYEDPTFHWNEPEVSAETDKKATVTVQLVMSTDDEKTAQQNLTFTAVHKTGWLVCDITG